jgi:hypothetical protein
LDVLTRQKKQVRHTKQKREKYTESFIDNSMVFEIEPYHLRKAKELGVEIQPSTKGNYKLDV